MAPRPESFEGEADHAGNIRIEIHMDHRGVAHLYRSTIDVNTGIDRIVHRI